MSDKDGIRDDLKGNPFVALFPSTSQAMLYASQLNCDDMVQEMLKGAHGGSKDDVTMEQENNDDEEEFDKRRIVNNLLQRIFLVSLQECKLFIVCVCYLKARIRTISILTKLFLLQVYIEELSLLVEFSLLLVFG